MNDRWSYCFRCKWGHCGTVAKKRVRKWHVLLNDVNVIKNERSKLKMLVIGKNVVRHE